MTVTPEAIREKLHLFIEVAADKKIQAIYTLFEEEIIDIENYHNDIEEAEKEILQQIAEQLGLIQLGEYHYCRHPLTYLLEAADDICYQIMDIEDAHKLHLISTEKAKELFLNFL